MSARKPRPKLEPESKPATSPLIEWPTKELQPVPVTVEHKVAASADESWHVETEH
jgi:hypothetical protein